MKRLLNPALVLIIIFFSLSCSTYSVKSDFKDKSVLSKVKNTGIIFRISNGSKITKEELIRNFLYWLSVYEQKGNVTVIADAGNSLTVYNNPQQRFYQLSNEEEYLEYKSLGVVNLYLQNNQNELLNIISKNNLDSIIVYEVYSVISTAMHFFEYDSVLAIADANLNIGYLDHQTDHFESESSFLEELKNEALDKITGRLIENLRDINLLGSLTEGGKKILIKDVGKIKPETEEKPVVKQEDKPADKALEKPEEKTVEKDIEKPAEKETEKPTDKPAEKSPVSTEVKPEEKSAEKQAPATVEKSAENQKDVKPEEKQKDTNTENGTEVKPEKKEEAPPEKKSADDVKPETKPQEKTTPAEAKTSE